LYSKYQTPGSVPSTLPHTNKSGNPEKHLKKEEVVSSVTGSREVSEVSSGFGNYQIHCELGKSSFS
jgi:hypothetical protein